MSEKEETPFDGAQYEFRCAIYDGDRLRFRATDDTSGNGFGVHFETTSDDGSGDHSVYIGQDHVPELAGALLSCLSAALRAPENKAAREQRKLYESLMGGLVKLSDINVPGDDDPCVGYSCRDGDGA